MKIVIKKDGFLWKKYHFRIVADNGSILCRSRKETTLNDCMLLLIRIKKFCKSEIGLTIEIVKNKLVHQKYHFRYIDDESNILAWSENYHNRKDCEDAVELIKTGINAAEIITL